MYNYTDVLKEKDDEIYKLQSNWNNLKDFLKNKIDNFRDDVSEPILHEQMAVRLVYKYMNELEKKR